VLADIDSKNLLRVETEIKSLGKEVETAICDVTLEQDNNSLAHMAVERFGAINLVVPCAGIIKDGLMISVDRATAQVTGKMSLNDFQAVLDVNLTGAFLTVRECAGQMINLGCSGLICLLSSVGSLGTAGQINYSSSKAAISVMPKVITAELFRRGVANRIRCVAVAPGYVATPMVKRMSQRALDKILQNVPIGRLIDPDEVASFIIELYCNEALAGEVFYIHGGIRLGSRG
jgi:3-oxoacyl-[acyl-carrier protein] reductase